MGDQMKSKLAHLFLATGLLASGLAMAGHPESQCDPSNTTTQADQTSQTNQTEQTNQTSQQAAQTEQDDSEKNICYTIGENYYKCARAHRYCFWDSEDGRCEPLNDTSYCGRLNKWSCQRQPSCFWDREDGRCETLE